MIDNKRLLMLMASGALLLSNLPANAGDLPAGNLVLTRSVYSGTAGTVTVGQALPGGGNATVNGSYPYVWANEAPDASFGITSPIMLDLLTVNGSPLNSVNLTNEAAALGVNLSTSFSSKSEMAINQATDGTGAFTLMGYIAPINTLDVSNSNTPANVDPTNPVAESFQRAVAQINIDGSLQITPVDSYSGNNGRAATLYNGIYYMVGNAGNGSGTEPTNIVNNTGVQITTPGGNANTTVVGVQNGTPGSKNGFEYGYSVVLNGNTADKSGKDDNFRGNTIYNNTLYVSKGSGSNGINTVYQVGAAGTLPNFATASSTPISILPGFSTTLASATSTPTHPVYHPFGIWFASPTTLYVADEGDGAAYTSSSKTHFGGLQKWIYNGTTWSLAYTLQNGLNLGTQYSVAGYPTALNPAADGLRNISGTVNGDGTVTIYGVTSTVSASTDAGADPNQLVAITDNIFYQTAAAAAGESFTTLKTAAYGEVLRGVAYLAPVDISSQVSVTTSDFIYSRATRLYTCTMTITNSGSTTINGSLATVLDNLPAGVTLTDATGATGSGSPYISTSSAVILAPGASTNLMLKFSNPSNQSIAFSPETYVQ